MRVNPKKGFDIMKRFVIQRYDALEDKVSYVTYTEGMTDFTEDIDSAELFGIDEAHVEAHYLVLGDDFAEVENYSYAIIEKGGLVHG